MAVEIRVKRASERCIGLEGAFVGTCGVGASAAGKIGQAPVRCVSFATSQPCDGLEPVPIFDLPFTM